MLTDGPIHREAPILTSKQAFMHPLMPFSDCGLTGVKTHNIRSISMSPTVADFFLQQLYTSTLYTHP